MEWEGNGRGGGKRWGGKTKKENRRNDVAATRA